MAELDLIQQLDRAVDAMFAGEQAPSASPEVGSLLRIARFIRDLPREDFRGRLKRDVMSAAIQITKEKNMATSTMTWKREGFHSLTPYLLVPQSARMMNFMKDALGATERFSVPRPDGSIMHAEVVIGDSVIELAENPPDQFGARPTPLHVYVPDVDAAYARALAAGGTSLNQPTDHEYGERGASVKDAAGNHWYLATARGPSHIPEGLHAVNICMHALGAPSLIDFLERAFSAEVAERHEAGGGGSAREAPHRRFDSGDE